MLRGYHHVTLRVTDLARSRASTPHSRSSSSTRTFPTWRSSATGSVTAGPRLGAVCTLPDTAARGVRADL